MKPRISFLTLGVEDLERAVAFYRDGLGWPTDGIVGEDMENGAVAFFKLQGGLTFGLWPRRSIAAETGEPLGPHSSTEFTLAHNVAERADVDALMAEAERAGARIVRMPYDTFYGGYAGWFADPDGHLWEVAWNPDALPPED